MQARTDPSLVCVRPYIHGRVDIGEIHPGRQKDRVDALAQTDGHEDKERERER